ncbi:putative zinc finger protein, partial [Orchesella cincta]
LDFITMPPTSKKRKSHFTEDLKKEFPYLEKKFKEDPNCSDIFCRMCSSTFSIANGGKYLINRHLDSDSSSKQITSFYSKNQPEAQDLELAAREGVFAFHTVLHNHSFRSMDCTAKIIQEMYDKKFNCSRTKCEAIAVKVLSPFVLESIRNEISNAAFVTLSLDCSNHGKRKISAVEVAVTLKSIVDNLGLRRSEKFIGSSTKKLLQKLDFEGEIREAKFMEYVDSFFETALEYLKNWTAEFDKTEKTDSVEALENVVTEAKCYGLNLDEAKLFDEYSCLNAYLTKENLVELESAAGIDEKWQRILHHFDAEAIPMPLLSLVVGFALCLPGTNASVERVFFIMNDVWSSEKTTLGLETLKALLNLKINANYSCRELHTELKKQPAILKQIHSSNKYL